MNKNEAPRNPEGRWVAGTSGNPSGRPVGSRNQRTLILEQLLDGEGEALTRKVIELAKKGDLFALRLCMERLLPPRKERVVNFALPKVAAAQHALAAFAAILEAIGEGQSDARRGRTHFHDCRSSSALDHSRRYGPARRRA